MLVQSMKTSLQSTAPHFLIVPYLSLQIALKESQSKQQDNGLNIYKDDAVNLEISQGFDFHISEVS